LGGHSKIQIVESMRTTLPGLSAKGLTGKVSRWPDAWWELAVQGLYVPVAEAYGRPMSALEDLAQVWVWRLELRVLGILGAAAFVVAFVVLDAIFGFDVAYYAFPVFFGRLAVAFVWNVGGAIWALMFGPGYIRIPEVEAKFPWPTEDRN
jgi:hypothetical protein